MAIGDIRVVLANQPYRGPSPAGLERSQQVGGADVAEALDPVLRAVADGLPFREAHPERGSPRERVEGDPADGADGTGRVAVQALEFGATGQQQGELAPVSQTVWVRGYVPAGRLVRGVSW